jgi:hypothetical protein
MESVYRPRPFDRFHRAGRQRTHCVRPPRHRPRHSPGRDKPTGRSPPGYRAVETVKRSSRGGPPACRKGRPPPPQDLCSRASEVPIEARHSSVASCCPRGCAGAGSLLSARRLCSCVASPPLNRAYPVRLRSRRPGPIGFHEIKHDGFRILAWREGERSRLLTRHGTDFTDRFPKIAAAVENLRVRSCVLNGVACRPG